MARCRRGDAGREPGGRCRSRRATPLRECRRRPRQRDRVFERRRPARRRHDCHFHQRSCSSPHCTVAGSARCASAARSSGVDRARAGATRGVAARRRTNGPAQAAVADRTERHLRPRRRRPSERAMAARSGGFLAMTPGHVSLVGAGPGDPGLLTRTAIARLRSADLVLYDALVGDGILRYARRAQRFFVGKRAGRHAMTQPAINALMIRAARRGKLVVRLKGGDPFVFGRGGEEALALQQAGVHYDVVAGISSAVAAPAAAGIPVTHRGVASAFLVVSAHEEEAFAAAIAQLQPNGVTLVVLMGLARSAAIACRLIDRGWSRGTPAAVVLDATRPGQQVWRGTLDALASDAATLDSGGAGTIIVGAVAALGLGQEQLRRQESRMT